MEDLHAPSYPDEETRLRHKRAWAAGFFDGEGWAAAVGSKRRHTRQPHAQINQSSTTGVPEVLVRFRDAVEGLGAIRGPQIMKGREPLYRWTVSSRGQVRRVYELLKPWLSGPKAAQFRRALAPLADGSLPLGHIASADVAARPQSESEEIGWAAGLFDGEGSTCLLKHRSHDGYFVGEVSVTQGGVEVPEVLERFHTVVRVGRVYGPMEQEGASGHVYRWKTGARLAIESAIALLWPWLGAVKRAQAKAVLSVLRAQPKLPRGNPAWGSYKTHCVRGHEYATARIRPYGSRRGGAQRRDSKQCLACAREQAKARAAERRARNGI